MVSTQRTGGLAYTAKNILQSHGERCRAVRNRKINGLLLNQDLLAIFLDADKVLRTVLKVEDYK